MGYILLYIDTGFATKTTTIISVIFPLLGIDSPLTLSSQLTECWAKFLFCTKIDFISCVLFGEKYNEQHHSIFAFILVPHNNNTCVHTPQKDRDRLVWCKYEYLQNYIAALYLRYQWVYPLLLVIYQRFILIVYIDKIITIVELLSNL